MGCDAALAAGEDASERALFERLRTGGIAEDASMNGHEEPLGKQPRDLPICQTSGPSLPPSDEGVLADKNRIKKCVHALLSALTSPKVENIAKIAATVRDCVRLAYTIALRPRTAREGSAIVYRLRT